MYYINKISARLADNTLLDLRKSLGSKFILKKKKIKSRGYINFKNIFYEFKIKTLARSACILIIEFV